MESIYERERIQQGGRSFFAVEWDADGAGEEKRIRSGYEKEALMWSGCSSYLPTRFMGREKALIACYDDTDFISLETKCRQAKERDESLISLTAGVFRRLTEGEREAEDFLLGGDRILYRSDCVFLHKRTGRTAMAYIPTADTRLFPERILSLARELQEAWPGNGLELFVEKLEEELSGGAGGTTGLLRLFSRWERSL